MQNKQGMNDGDNQVLTEAVSGEHQTLGERRWVEVLKRRWPSALGGVVGLVAAFDVEITAGSISVLAAFPVIMALVYLGAAAVSSASCGGHITSFRRVTSTSACPSGIGA